MTQARLATLRSRLTSLREGALPGTAAERLRILGDLGRRAVALEMAVAELDGAVRQLTAQAVAGALGILDPIGLEQLLTQAAQEAVEAALSEGTERAEWLETAWGALLERDGAESMLWCCERWTASAGIPLELARQLRGALSRMDAALASGARAWTGLNRERREALEELDPRERPTAWWFSRRSSCDGLLPSLAGGPPDEGHVSGCADCREDHQRAGAVNERGLRHVSSAQLWRYESGELAKNEREDLDRHAQGCTECALALSLAAQELEPPEEQRGETVDEQESFRIVVHRHRGRVRLQVQRRSSALTQVAALLPPYREPLRALMTSDGYAFDLGDEQSLRGVQLRPRLTVSGQAMQEVVTL